MDYIYKFFEVNEIIVIFIYGMIFFIIGFGISLKNRQHSRFRLAKSLQWLALFGILHAVADWGHLFIPLQKAYASEQAYVILRTIRVFVNSLSFMFLLQFSLSLLYHTHKRLRFLRFIPICLFALWFIQLVLYNMFLDVPGDDLWWVRVADIWSRYILALPGTILSSYAILLQKDEFRNLGYHKFINTLYLTSFSLLIYGITAGLIVPEGSVFLATLINQNLFFSITGLPIELFRAGSGLLLAFSILQIIKVFDTEYIHRIQESEKTKAVFDERNRIAQDLHDGIIQSLYAANLQLEAVKYLIDTDHSNKASQELAVFLSRRSHIISQIREYIGELKRVTQTNLSLKDRIEDQLEELRVRDKLNVKINFIDDNQDISITILYHLTLIIKEALSNVMKHARAKNVEITINCEYDSLYLEISDDGVGMDFGNHQEPSEIGSGLGLQNMERRVATLNGQINILSPKKKGTKISIQIPIVGGVS